MEDMTCPVCDAPLAETRSTRAVSWACPSCGGRAIGIALLRRSAERGWVNELWGHVSGSPATGDRRCPSCGRAMTEGTAGRLTLDVCRGCQMVWFDSNEYSAAPTLPERGARTLPQEALERAGRVEATAIAAKYNRRFPERMTAEEALPLVPGLAGLPIEDEARGLAAYPWVTWSLTAILFVLGVWSLLDPGLRDGFGVVAVSIDRLGGAALITSLFLHASVFQLATNLYFLLFFGDNVEDALGPVVFGSLLLAGGLAGNATHVLLDADNPAVLVGASGSISAVVVFYGLRFPDVQLRFVRLLRWHTMPARAGLLFWILLKVASTQPLLGRAEPSVWPYVGGAAIGLVYWLVFRDTSVWTD